MPTLYQLADAEIRVCIADYLALAADTRGFAAVTAEAVNTDRKAIILLAGLNAPIDDGAPDAVVREWARRRAVPMDIETGITAGVYRSLRGAGELYLEEVRTATEGFANWSPDYIHDNPHTLPLLQHLAGVFSKATLKKRVGQVSDTGISRPAAARLADLLANRVVPGEVREGEILQRLEATLEGIVRKGMHHEMLGILVVDGEWTAETLVVMARIFDYVVPLREVNDLAQTIAAYLAGDTTKLRWLINFNIRAV